MAEGARLVRVLTPPEVDPRGGRHLVVEPGRPAPPGLAARPGRPTPRQLRAHRRRRRARGRFLGARAGPARAGRAGHRGGLARGAHRDRPRSPPALGWGGCRPAGSCAWHCPSTTPFTQSTRSTPSGRCWAPFPGWSRASRPVSDPGPAGNGAAPGPPAKGGRGPTGRATVQPGRSPRRPAHPGPERPPAGHRRPGPERRRGRHSGKGRPALLGRMCPLRRGPRCSDRRSRARLRRRARGGVSFALFAGRNRFDRRRLARPATALAGRRLGRGTSFRSASWPAWPTCPPTSASPASPGRGPNPSAAPGGPPRPSAR